jgi:DNA polymerase III delta prime subunit
LDQFDIKPSNSLDITKIGPQKSTISIEEIKKLKKQIYLKPINLPYKVVLVEQAETLTNEAQNALLKVFEEPPQHAIIILITSSAKNILPTLVSRAVIIKVQEEVAVETASFIEQNIIDALENVANVEKPQVWLREQIIANYNLLIADINNEAKRKKTAITIKNCLDAKKMLEANVSGRFVLANLILSSINNS